MPFYPSNFDDSHHQRTATAFQSNADGFLRPTSVMAPAMTLSSGSTELDILSDLLRHAQITSPLLRVGLIYLLLLTVADLYLG